MNRAQIFDALLKHSADKRHSILIGARQVGKTTVVKQVLAHLQTKKKKAFFLTFEEPEILAAINQHPENIFNFTVHPKDLEKNERLYLIIDEIQYAANPTNFLKLLYDKYEGIVKIIATGSSAFYIDRNFKDSLAGRKKVFELYSLDFKEFLHFKGKDDLIVEYEQIQKRKKYKSASAKILKSYFDEFLTYGGYPAVVLENNLSYKKDLLAELVNSYMKKDALEADIKEELKFFNLVKILSHQVGELVNQNELAGTLKLSVGTIDNYLYLLRKCFHVNLLQPKFGNVRKELTKMPKVFFNDLGLRNYLCNQLNTPINDRADKGALIENYAYIRLRQLYGTDALRYWRTADGNEVDFVVEESIYAGKAYEVKFSERQYKASKYKKFVEAYPDFPLEPMAYNVESDDVIDIFKF